MSRVQNLARKHEYWLVRYSTNCKKCLGIIGLGITDPSNPPNATQSLPSSFSQDRVSGVADLTSGAKGLRCQEEHHSDARSLLALSPTCSILESLLIPPSLMNIPP